MTLIETELTVPERPAPLRALTGFGIDIDGTTADTVNALLEHINREHALALAYQDVRDYWVDDWLADQPPLAELRDRLIHDTEFYASLTPLPDAVEAVSWLTGVTTCHFITARPAEFRAVSSAWLERVAFPAGLQVHCDGKKADLAQRLGLSHFIEDSAGQAQRLAAAGLRVYLLDSPWNRQLEAPASELAAAGGSIRRVASWRELHRLLQSELQLA